jgi:IS5 family transposase
MYRQFAGLAGSRRIPDETTIFRFRHLLERYELASKILVTVNAGFAV